MEALLNFLKIAQKKPFKFYTSIVTDLLIMQLKIDWSKLLDKNYCSFFILTYFYQYHSIILVQLNFTITILHYLKFPYTIL